MKNRPRQSAKSVLGQTATTSGFLLLEWLGWTFKTKIKDLWQVSLINGISVPSRLICYLCCDLSVLSKLELPMGKTSAKEFLQTQ